MLRKRPVSATKDGGAPRISAWTRCFAVGSPVAALPCHREDEATTARTKQQPRGRSNNREDEATTAMN